jgi:hypothetical protein
VDGQAIYQNLRETFPKVLEELMTPHSVVFGGADPLFAGSVFCPVGAGRTAIRFRFDEKRFDVDGAYDIRYEIVKKRIDKALIKGSTERATQPGRLVIVYSQATEAQEYRGYLEYLQSLGMENVQEHERELATYAIKRLNERGAEVFGPKETANRGGAVSFWYNEIHPHDLAQVLGQEGVCIRAGHHCAQPLMRILGVPATSRASFYVYNTLADVDAFIEALGKAERIFGA